MPIEALAVLVLCLLKHWQCLFCVTWITEGVCIVSTKALAVLALCLFQHWQCLSCAYWSTGSACFVSIQALLVPVLRLLKHCECLSCVYWSTGSACGTKIWLQKHYFWWIDNTREFNDLMFATLEWPNWKHAGLFHWAIPSEVLLHVTRQARSRTCNPLH